MGEDDYTPPHPPLTPSGHITFATWGGGGAGVGGGAGTFYRNTTICANKSGFMSTVLLNYVNRALVGSV